LPKPLVDPSALLAAAAAAVWLLLADWFLVFGFWFIAAAYFVSIFTPLLPAACCSGHE
jgi:hypothetical protein